MVKTLGFSAEYVERITPNERYVYMMLYRKEMEEKRKQQEFNEKIK